MKITPDTKIICEHVSGDRNLHVRVYEVDGRAWVKISASSKESHAIKLTPVKYLESFGDAKSAMAVASKGVDNLRRAFYINALDNMRAQDALTESLEVE